MNSTQNKRWEEKIFSVIDEKDFEKLALEIFIFQAQNNLVYSQFLRLLQCNINKVSTLKEIPFLPIDFFKTHNVTTGNFSPEMVFESSGTTGQIPSRHFIADASLYEKSFTKCFQKFFGDPRQWCILALLPSYIERGNSSLVYMVNHLMQVSAHPNNNFFLHDHEHLLQTLQYLEDQNQETLLIGVSFALLDFAEKFPIPLQSTTIMETGGMKGNRKEITREDLHRKLCSAFKVEKIFSEYGMTELLSQSYALKNGIFKTPPWMKVLIRDAHDPFNYHEGTTGGINVIDLANIHSCAFIQTSDLGKINDNNTFEVLGRMDDAEIRGCNLFWQ